MIQFKKILFIALMFCIIGSHAYGYNYETLSGEKLINSIEKNYNIKIVVPNDDYEAFKENLLILDKNLKRFPAGVINEITDSNSKNGISTSVILGKTEKISDLFAEYKIKNNTAEIYLNTMINNLYYDSCHATELVFVHEMAHYASDYLYKVYGYEKIKNEFERLNSSYVYGTWGEGYENAFVDKHSAKSFEDDITDLIWHLEVHPEVIRKINNGNYTIIHKKIEYLAKVIESSFSSVTDKTQLWQEAFPQQPDAWAINAVNAMNNAALIPKELEGIYNSYITKQDFYSLALNIMESKLGKESFIKLFELTNQEKSMAIDPLKGEICVDSALIDSLSNEEQGCFDKNDRVYEALQIGLLDELYLDSSNDYISRLEIAKLFNYLISRLGMDVSDFKVINYIDINNVAQKDKPSIYLVASKKLLMGDGISFKPFDYCTYQEAYIILMRLYDLL